MANHRPWYKHVWPWVLIALVVIIAGIRIAATPLATHYTQQAIDRIPGYTGTFSKVKLSFIHLKYTIEDLKLTQVAAEKSDKETSAPYLYVGMAEGHLVWRDLLHGHLGGAASIERAKVTVIIPQHPPKKKVSPPDLATVLYNMFPFRIDHVDLLNDQLVVIDESEPEVPEKSRELWIHDIQASLDNVGTRRSLTKGEPTTLTMKAKVQRSGTLTVFVTADPLTHGLNFAGETSLKGLKLEDLWGFMVGKAQMQPVSGTLDAFAAFKCVKGHIDGAVKPELKNANLKSADTSLGDKIKTKLADAALKLTSDRVPGRNANVAIIPLKGSVTNPKAELWPTVLSVLRNAYVEAIAGGFTHVPPGTAQPGQGPLKQAAQAFNPKKFPKAQPQKKGKGK